MGTFSDAEAARPMEEVRIEFSVHAYKQVVGSDNIVEPAPQGGRMNIPNASQYQTQNRNRNRKSRRNTPYHREVVRQQPVYRNQNEDNESGSDGISVAAGVALAFWAISEIFDL